MPMPDDKLEDVPYVTFAEGSPELEYMRARRMALGGYLPKRRAEGGVAAGAGAVGVRALLKSTGRAARSPPRWRSCASCTSLLRDKALGKRIVPIVPDESRTFGMEGMFRQLGIWNQQGQKYTPEDTDQLMFYQRDARTGRSCRKASTKPAAMCDWIAAATSYSTHGVPMIPFYIFYSMFGFQRVGDLAWAAGDMRSRGFLLGGTAGRTTLNGEGLQHEDGHSQLCAASIPNCVSLRPDVRLRTRGDHAGRPAPHGTPSRRTCTTTSR